VHDGATATAARTLRLPLMMSRLPRNMLKSAPKRAATATTRRRNVKAKAAAFTEVGMSDTMDAKLKRTRRTASVDLDALYQIIMLKCGFHDSALRPRDASANAASDVGALAQQFENNRKDYPADAELIFYLLHDHISGEQKAPQKKLRAVFQKVLMRFCVGREGQEAVDPPRRLLPRQRQGSAAAHRMLEHGTEEGRERGKSTTS
jgi:hypothetical protein